MFVLIVRADFTIDCSLEDSTNPALDGMELLVLGLGDEITWQMKRVTPTSWKYHQVIQL